MLAAAAALAGLAVSGTPYVKSVTLYQNQVASIDATCEDDNKLYYLKPVNNSKSGFMSTTDAPGCTPSVLAQGDVSATDARCWSVAFIREGESVVRTFGMAAMFHSNTPAFQLAFRTWIDMQMYHNDNPSLQDFDAEQLIADILGPVNPVDFRPGNDRDGYLSLELIQDMIAHHLGPGKSFDLGFPCNTCVKGDIDIVSDAKAHVQLFQRCNPLIQELETANPEIFAARPKLWRLDVNFVNFLRDNLPEKCFDDLFFYGFFPLMQRIQEIFPGLKKDVFIECGEM